MFCSLSNPTPNEDSIRKLDREIKEFEKIERPDGTVVRAIESLKKLRTSLKTRLTEDDNLLRWKRENDGGYSVRNAVRHALPNKR